MNARHATPLYGRQGADSAPPLRQLTCYADVQHWFNVADLQTLRNFGRRDARSVLHRWLTRSWYASGTDTRLRPSRSMGSSLLVYSGYDLSLRSGP